MSFSPEETLACRKLVDLALAEDLGPTGDLTSLAVIPSDLQAQTVFVARAAGVLAGLPAAALVAQEVDPALKFKPNKEDGDRVLAGEGLATLAGPMRSILAAERTALNFLQHLSGIATLTRSYVDAVAGLPCKILDTRKTIPGWRLPAKYAVRQGGGCNHRLGLYDGILIKDNHLAALKSFSGRAARRKPAGNGRKPLGIETPAGSEEDALMRAAKFKPDSSNHKVWIEIEVENLEHLEKVFAGRPDMVLLDNMNLDQLRQAVRLRDAHAPGILLEASGGINLVTVRAIAETGVDRISVGALTHSAPALDIALDYSF